MALKSFEQPEFAEKPLLCRRHVASGLALWVVFCIVAVAVRGVRWDEQYEFAQVIARQVQYPQGHPYPYCVRNALNLQIYATAGLLKLIPDAAVVCGFRNFLYLLATVAPVYLLGALLGGRALAGHAAAALILLGAHEEFDACYQMFAWPAYASTGHVGLGYALSALALLAGGHLRAGLFMLGLMPCIHIGQMPILLAWAAIAGGGAVVWNRSSALKPLMRAAPWGLAGLAVCLAVWISKGAIHVPLPESGPYFSTADPAQVWAGYIAQDALRALPGRPTSYTNSFIILAGAVLLTGGYCGLKRSGGRGVRDPQCAVWLYVLLAAAAVWGVMALHYLLGARTPYVLISWMPYRFANHAAYILIAVVAAIACGLYPRIAGKPNLQFTMAMVLLAGAFRPVSAWFLPADFYGRYIASGEGLLFFLTGAACASLLAPQRSKTGAALAILSGAALGLTHQFGLLCAAAGFLTAMGATRWSPTLPARWAFSATACGVAASVAVLAANQGLARQHLPMSPFDRRVVEYLDARDNAQAMLLARPDQYTLQAKTGHPVVADTCLAPWIPYMPSIGPAIQKIHQDFYGESFYPPHKPDWGEVWRNRGEDDWQRLAREYGVEYVVSPNHVPLQLPVAVNGTLENLYAIPGN